MKFVERYLYEDVEGANPVYDTEGLWSGRLENKGMVFSLNDIVSGVLCGGLILGEGDCGKSCFIQMIEDALPETVEKIVIRIREYPEFDAGRLEERIDSFVAQKLSEERVERRKCILIDGLDERPDHVWTISRVVRRYSTRPNVNFWITSRMIGDLREFSTWSNSIKRYRLAPLTRDGVKALADLLDVDGAVFYNAVRQACAIDFCAKPGGCVSCVDVFRRGNGTMGNPAKLLSDIARAMVQEHRDGVNISLEQVGLRNSDDELMDCAGWLATVLLTQGCRSFFLGDALAAPKGTTAISSWVTNMRGRGLMAEVLKTRLFEPFGCEEIRFSFARLPSYLAARWLQANVSKENISCVLGAGSGLHSPEFEQLDTWLTVLSPDLHNASRDIIESAYDKLQERYVLLSDDERRTFFGPKLAVLASESDFVKRIVRERIASSDTDSAGIEFAIDVATYCDIDLTREIVEVLLDATREIDIRKTLSYELRKRCGSGYQKDLKRLRALLKDPPTNLMEESILANVLSVLWPEDISVPELLAALRHPVDKHVYAAYEYFCRQELPATFKQTLTRETAVEFLSWARDFISLDEPFDYIGELAREIFAWCWRWVLDFEIAHLMADCVVRVHEKKGYSDGLPFPDRRDSVYSQFPILNTKDFISNHEARMSLLKALVERRDLPLDLIDSLLGVSAHPICVPEDFGRLVDMIKNDPRRERGIVRCLKYLVYRISLSDYDTELEWLHSRYPDDHDFSKKAIFEERERIRALQTKSEKRLEAERARQSREQEKRRDDIFKLLDENKAHGSWFFRLAEALTSEDWESAVPELHLTSTKGWLELNETRQEHLVDFARRFLGDLPDLNGPHDASGIYVASALVLLQEKGVLTVDLLSTDIWQGVVLRLLQSTYDYDDDLEVAAIVDVLQREIPDVVDAALLQAVRLCYEEDYSDPLPWWMRRMTRREYDAILAYLKKAVVHGARLERLLRSLREYDDKESLNELIARVADPKSTVPPGKDKMKILSLAFEWEPDSYIDYIRRLRRDYPEWFGEWLACTLTFHDHKLADVFVGIGAEAAREMYGWLIEHYPSQQAPNHKGAFVPTAKDEIYFFKDRLLSLMRSSGQLSFHQQLEALAREYPKERDFEYDLAQSREQMRKGASWSALLSEDDLKALSELKRGSGQQLVANSEDLLGVVHRALASFGCELQKELLPVRALWCEVPLSLWCQKPCDDKECMRSNKRNESVVFPRDESALSDAIAIFLRTNLGRMIVNREPMTSPRSQRGSEKRAGFVDVKVECLLPSGERSTVFVEVKCNFNPTLKTALKDQLLDKYVASRPGSAGILLCGCYEATNWVDCDSRKGRRVKGFRNVKSAQKKLDAQIRALPAKVKAAVKSIAIDCGLH